MNLYRTLHHLKNKMMERKHQAFNVGAVIITRNGTPLSYGYNSYVKTHPRMLFNRNYVTHKIFVHAECDAIYKLHKGNKAWGMIIARIGFKNHFLMSKPCIGCQSEIKNFGIKHVYYTSDDQELVLLDF